MAVKVVPFDASGHPERLRRFQEEARAVAALNHPAILTVYDVGTTDAGSPYLVFELLEGETLRTRLARGGVSTREAIDWGMQAARALGAAHDQGVLHRDVKPDNLFRTRDGRIKVLDFGLAKLVGGADTAAEEGRDTTVSAPSAPGAVAGTAGYMAPERVRGQPADARSDVFSLGAVLYEMLSGRRAFRGATSAEAMAAVLRDDPPDLAAANRDLPRPLERIVMRCLAKRPEERFQSAHDVAFALEAVADVSTSGRAAPAEGQTRRRPAVLAAAMAVLAVAGAAAVIAWPRREAAAVPSFQRLTFRRGTVARARFAPGGRTIVYSALWDGSGPEVYSTLPGATESRSLLPGAVVLAVSPSGELACLSVPDQTLTLAMLSGGAPRASLEGVKDVDWTDDGSAMLVLRTAGHIELPAGTLLYRPPPEHRIEFPRFSPGGEAIAFVERRPDQRASLRLVDRAGKARTLSADWEALESLAWSPDGHEVWFTGGRDAVGPHFIRAVTRDGRERVVLASPTLLNVEDVAPDGQVLLTRNQLGFMANVATPEDGEERDFSWLDGTYVTDLSRDGRRMLFYEWFEGGGPSYATYIRATDGGAAVRLGPGRGAALSPDGQWVFLAPRTPGKASLVPTGAGQARELDTGAVSEFQHAEWSADGKRIAFVGREPGRHWRAFVLDLEAGGTRPVTPDGMRDRHFALSPDGRVLAGSPRGTPVALYPLAGGEPRPVPGLDAEDEPVRWSADGRSLYVIRRSRTVAKLFRYDLATAAKEHVRDLAPSDPAGVKEIFSAVVTPDGQSWAYTYRRWLSDLYLAKGLR